MKSLKILSLLLLLIVVALMFCKGPKHSSDPSPKPPTPPPQTNPVVKVVKSMSPLGPDKSGIDLLESATISITVHGATIHAPIETSVVVLLDESGSMGNTNLHPSSRAAAKNFISGMKSSDKIALVTFSDNKAYKRVALSTNHQAVINAIDNLPEPSGKTNTKAAFDMANQMLVNDKTAIKKAAFLFTDGMPTPETQKDYLYNKRPYLRNNNISYYAVGYGNFSKSWLMDLANQSGGSYCEPKKPTDILQCFLDFWKNASEYGYPQQVSINEVLSSNFKVKQGSLTQATGGGLDLSSNTEFNNAMTKAENDFYKTGTLTTPPIYEIRHKRFFEVKFDVIAMNCESKLALMPVNDINKTYLTYKYGPKTLTITHPEFNQVKIPVNPCGVYIDKTFESVNRKITIEIRNSFQDRSVQDIHVIEILGEHISPMAGAETPRFRNLIGQVAWPHYPKTSQWEPDGMEWRIFDGIPTDVRQKYPPYYYIIKGSSNINPHGYLESNSKLTFTLPIIVKKSAEGISPIIINKKEGFTGEISEAGATISFWYYVTHDESNIKTEQVGKYTYKYFYEALPVGFPGKWDYKRYVMIYLPELSVPFLQP